MSILGNYRYDPLYRVIDVTPEMRTIEGHLRVQFDRLKSINNLGIIPEVVEMAKYNKYEHSFGTIHQINSLLHIDTKIPHKYHQPLKIAAKFLHLGHLPFTYSTERAIVISCYISEKANSSFVKDYLSTRIQNFGRVIDLQPGRIDTFKKDIISLRELNLLYKVISANILLDNWRRLYKKFDPKLDGATKKTIIANLVDFDSDGYRFLQLADQVDYVQRDALYFGAIRLDISPKHLYDGISQNTLLNSEEVELLEANLGYLVKKFYKRSDVIVFSRLYEKIVAALVASEKFKLERLLEYDDDSFRWLITEYKDRSNNSANLPQGWISRVKKLFKKEYDFKEIFTLPSVDFPANKSILDIEFELVNKNNDTKELLEYPFETGVVLSVDYSSGYDPDLGNQGITISAFQDSTQTDLTELLFILKKLSPYISLTNVQIIKERLCELLSWTGCCRINNNIVLESIAKAIQKIEEEGQGIFTKDYVLNLSKREDFNMLWNDFNLSFWRKTILEDLECAIKNPDFDRLGAYENIIEGIFSLPIDLIESEESKRYLARLYSKLNEMIASPGANSEKGKIFEAMCVLKTLLKQRDGFRLIINGFVVVNPEEESSKQDNKEFDIIEIFIDRDGKSEVWIYACSISDDIKAKNRESLTTLVDSIHERFPDQRIRSKYYNPTNKRSGNWEPKEDDAGRNVN